MKHINADKLREYKFGLLAETEATEIAAHLEACGECRQKFQALEKQFQTLEVLRDQPEVSEELISSIMVESQKVVSFRPKAVITQWKPVLATAALLMICFAILKYAPQDPKPEEDGYVRSRTEESTPADLPMVAETPQTKDESALREVDAFVDSRSKLKVAKKQPVTKKSLSQSLLADTDMQADAIAPIAQPVAAGAFKSSLAAAPLMRVADAEEAESIDALRAQQPFVPASNIELNVLPRRDEVQLTIYNEEDLTLVREKRKLTLKRGWNWLQFMWSNTLIDPTSLELEPKTHADQIEITQLVYPPRLNELARWTIFSEISGEAEFELTYFTSGLKWNAFYEATLSPDEQAMQLTSYVRVDNGSGEDYENAQTRFVDGIVNLTDPIKSLASRDHPYDCPKTYTKDPIHITMTNDIGDITVLPEINFFGSKRMAANSELYKLIKKPISIHFLYTIEGRETIPNGWGKRLPSFEAQEIGVTNLYKFDEERWGQNTMRFLSFANRKEHKLGETPLPNGRMWVFAQGREGSPSRPGGALGDRALPLRYIGAANIKYIPIGEEVELELGAAQKVKVEPKLMRTRTENFEFDSKGNINGWDEITDWKIDLTNTRGLPVELEITRATGSNYWTVGTQNKYEKYDAAHLRFTVKLEPQSRQDIRYELTTHHGTRTEQKK